VQCSVEGIDTPEWQLLVNDQLHRFHEQNYPLVRSLEQWHPREDDVIAQVAEEMRLPIHVVDQLYAQLLDSMRVSEPINENSPWHVMDDME